MLSILHSVSVILFSNSNDRPHRLLLNRCIIRRNLPMAHRRAGKFHFWQFEIVTNITFPTLKIVINITFSTFFQNVGSANYIHVLDRTVQEFEHLPVGQKYWVFIPRYHSHLFEKLCDIILRDLNYLCPNYLAHRFLMANPQLLLDAGIDVFHAVQYEGQTMVIFPKVYHCGKLNLKIYHIKL